jgi:bilirubin oxidase
MIPLTAQTVLLFVLASTIDAATLARKSPPLKNTFNTPLQIPPIKKPLATYTNPATNIPIDFYQLEVRETSQNFFPQLGPAKVLGYDGTFPGPTFRVAKGRESVVRVVNNGTRKMNFHLHGSYTRSPWDGWAEDVVSPGEYKDYYYPNSISGRTLWYHDHAHKENAINAYKGMFGMYQIVDEDLDRKIGIPSGSNFDVPLLFSSQFFTEKGDLTDETKERNSIYGDTWLVNGQVQPFKAVEATRYRFRVLNGAVSRVLNITIEADGVPIQMAVIGSDGGSREGPALTKSLIAGMAERWEIIVDFAPYAGKQLTVRATSMWTDPTFADSDKVMQFRVGVKNPGAARFVDKPLPERFPDVSIQFPTSKITATREFKLVSHMDMMWGINSYHMDESMKRVLMRPPLGTIEKYIFRSSGMSMGGMGGKDMGGMGGMGGMNMDGAKDTKPASLPAQAPMPAKDGGHSSHHRRTITLSSAKFVKRQMDGMVDGKGMEGMQGMHGGKGMGDMMGKDGKANGGMGGMNMGSSNNYWTHAMHLHLVVSFVMSYNSEYC